MLRAFYAISSFLISYKRVKFHILFRPKSSSILSRGAKFFRIVTRKSKIIYNLKRINFKRYFHVRTFFIVLML